VISPHSLTVAAGSLAVGAGGGVLFAVLGLPLPWMLGALTATILFAMAGVPLKLPEAVRPPVIAVIGVLLGAGFKPELLQQAASWLWSLSALALYIVIAGALTVPFYRRVAGFDRVTAYFAGMPGGLLEMMTIGRSMGADDRQVILAHAARIVVAVAAVAFWFRLVLGYEVSGNPGGTPLVQMAPLDVALLVACGVVGALAAVHLRLPAPTLLGPMVLSGAAHLADWTASAPPGGLVVVAQVVIGTVMGCRFVGVAPRDVARALLLSAGATGMVLAVAVAFAGILHLAMGLRADQVLLAYAPGGLSEMSLVALATGADVAFVALHHVVRIVLVIVAAPLVFRLLR
jgi:uncharacterized protein